MSDQSHTPPVDKSAVAALLQSHDIQPTQQRVEIAQVLFARPQHLCAEEVLAAVNRAGNVASKATVYNTLGLFARKGLVREVIVDPARVFYDSNTAPHHHFYNVDTGELTDIGTQCIAITGLPELPPGTEADGVEVIVRLRQGN